jgi:hypothetical protein
MACVRCLRTFVSSSSPIEQLPGTLRHFSDEWLPKRRPYRAAAEDADHGTDHRLVGLEILHRARLIGAHERTVAGNFGGEDGC